MSQISSKFQSKIPRPVIKSTGNKVDRSNIKLFKTPSSGVVATKPTSSNDFKIPLTSHKRVESKPSSSDVTRCVKGNEPGAKDETVKSTRESKQCRPTFKQGGYASEDEFQPDEKALECILSNKPLSPKMLGTRQSSQQPWRKSSIYHQSQSRMSLIESHTDFKEKMKILNEYMKSHNIKCEATPKGEKVKTTSTTASGGRPVNIYHKIQPLQSKNATINTTPQAEQPMPQQLSLSERKELQHKDFNDQRLCRTSSKVLSQSNANNTTSTRGKENSCRFKLFASPIHEIPENISSSSSTTDVLASQKSASSSLQTLTSKSQRETSQSQPENHHANKELLNTCISSQGVIVASSGDSKTVSSFVSKSMSEITPSTPHLSHPRQQTSGFSSASCIFVSTPTISTWTMTTKTCTPILELTSSKTEKNNEPVTPVLQTSCSVVSRQTDQNEDWVTPVLHRDTAEKCEANTPSGTWRRMGSVHKKPQRTPVGLHSVQSVRKKPQRTLVGLHSVKSVQDSDRGNVRSPFLCSYLKNKLDSGN